MGTVLDFVHATASLAPDEARASKVTCEQPLASASRAISSQRRAGMPRVRQVLTVETSTPRADATAVVPPRSLIVASEVSITPTIVGNSPTCQELASCQPTDLLDCGAMPLMAHRHAAIGKRLELTRIVLEFPRQVDFYTAIKVDKSDWSHFESGERRITLGVAMRIKQQFGITLDWIYCGDPSGLPLHISQKLSRTAA